MVQNLVYIDVNKCKIDCLGGSLNEKQVSMFVHFL